MAFTPEDDTGLIDANSYADVAFADAYFSERGIDTWTGSASEKQQALVKGTDYIESRFGGEFGGIIEFPETPQALAFPRLRLYDQNDLAVSGVPTKLKQATCEYALRSMSAVLLADPAIDKSGSGVRSRKKKTGPLSEEVVYSSSSGAVSLPEYPAADNMIKFYLQSQDGEVIR